MHIRNMSPEKMRQLRRLQSKKDLTPTEKAKYLWLLSWERLMNAKSRQKEAKRMRNAKSKKYQDWE